MKKFITFIVLIVIIGGIIYLWQNKSTTSSDQSVVNEQNQTILSVDFNFAEGEKTSFEYPYNYEVAESLFKVTKTIAEQQNWSFIFEDYGDMGLLITQIDAKTNGDNNNYWQYYVNDEQPLISVEKYFPQAGDAIEWKFQPSEF